jgi:3-oxoadipate enol-lactonase
MLQIHNGRKIHFDLLGMEDAPVVCLVHSLATDSGMWAEQVPALLKAGFQVLRVDLRGHGGSDAVVGRYSMYDLADDVAATLDYLGIAKVSLVGLSIGGMIAQAFADSYEDRLESVVFCDTQPASFPDAGSLWGPREQVVRQAGSLAPIADGMVERWLSEEFRGRNTVRSKLVFDTIVATDIEGWAGCAAAIQDFDFTGTLPKLRRPALVIFGAEDPATPPADNRRIAELVPSARFVAIENANHLPNIERAGQFNQILIDFLKSNLP